MVFSMGSPGSERKCDVYSRWWTTTHHQTVSRGILLFVFCLIVLLPCAYSEEQHSLQRSRDDGGKTLRFAEIDVSFIDPDTKKKTKAHYQGKYGVKSIIAHVSGVLMHAKSKVKPDSKSSATNHSGCSEYVNKKFPKGAWIAFVERGDCQFTKKIKIATKVHNASAIVIYNNGGASEVMNHDDTASISVFLMRKDGLKIVELLNRGTKVDMTIGPGEEVPTNMPNSISKTSVLFVSVSFIVLMVVSLAWLVFYYIQRFRYSHAKERLARLLACAAKKAIAKIPQKTIKAGDKELEGDFDQCAVCIEHYKPHDVIRILPCRHIFHKSCIDPWLLDQRSCPMCKLDILRAYGMQVSGSQESVHRDPESGPARQTISEDAEVRFSVMEDNRAEVLLVPPTWLHVHAGRDDEEDGDARAGHELEDDDVDIRQASASSHHSPGPDSDYITVLLPSSPAMGCSHNNVSRAQKKDKEDSLNAETKALISNGMEVKHQLSVDEDEDEDNDGRQGEAQAFSFRGHGASPEGPEDEQGRPACIADAASSCSGSSSSSQGLGLCKEINVNVEVNHETSA